MRLILPAIVDLVFANDSPQGVAARIDSCMKGLVSGSTVCVMTVAGVRRTGDSVGGRGRVWIDRVKDEVLLKRVASGDERGLSDLYDRYASLVYGTGMRLPGDTGADPSGVLSRRSDVATALSRLSPVHRELLVLAYFQGLSQREISERTNVPLGTVKSRTTAALRALRETMGFDEDRWSAGE